MFSLGAPESKYALQKLYKFLETKGKEKLHQKSKKQKQKPQWQQNNAEINWNTGYKSEATSTVHY